MENKEYLLSFFVIDNNGDEIDSDTISIDAADEKDARTKSMVFLKKKDIKVIDGKLNLLHWLSNQIKRI